MPRRCFAGLETKARADIETEGWMRARPTLPQLHLRYAGRLRTAHTLDGLLMSVCPRDTRRPPVCGSTSPCANSRSQRKDRPVEIVSYRLRLRVEVPKFERRERHGRRPPRRNARKGTGSLVWRRACSCVPALYERDRLDPGAVLTGPAIVEQFDTRPANPSRAGASRRRNCGRASLLYDRGAVRNRARGSSCRARRAPTQLHARRQTRLPAPLGASGGAGRRPCSSRRSKFRHFNAQAQSVASRSRPACLWRCDREFAHGARRTHTGGRECAADTTIKQTVQRCAQFVTWPA